MIIGITGSIASGKSLASQYFKDRGYEVLDADLVTRELQEEKSVLAEMAAAFGEDILDSEGKLLRRKLRERIFGDKKAVAKINAILHPKVRAVFEERAKTVKAEDLVFFDVPLLFEAKFDDLCEEIILISAKREVQIARIQKRDGSSREVAEKILDSQGGEEEKRAKASICIENNSSIEEFYRKLRKWEEEIHENCRSSRK